MSGDTATMPVPAVPLDVLDYAYKQDLVHHLRPLILNTRDIFPTAPILLRLDEDAEIADCWTIVIEVDVTGWTVDEMFAARTEWSERLFKICLASDVGHFRISMVQKS